MTYEQLAGKMGALLDDLEEFTVCLQDYEQMVETNPSSKILLEPETIWKNVINDLQNILDTRGGEDA